MAADESHDDRTRVFIALTADTTVSHYRIIQKIGVDGMGEVYLAEDTELGSKAALRFPPSHLCQVSDCRVRFKREALTVAELERKR